jgi:arabinoxylan arabinofuranohydrolase
MAKMDTCLISFLKNSSGPKWLALLSLCAAALTVPACAQLKPGNAAGANPIIRDKFTADPAPLVVGDTLYLYVGHDEAQGDEMFTMRDWLVYSTRDMKTWTEHAPIMKAKDFKWATGDAWASQARSSMRADRPWSPMR